MPRIRKGLVHAAALVAMVTSGVAVTAVVASPAQAALSSLCNFTAAEPVLTRGSTGTAVKQMQCQYNYSTRGANIAVDGSFGPATEAAVRRFQACVGIAVDGSVGPVTWSHLDYWAASSTYPANC